MLEIYLWDLERLIQKYKKRKFFDLYHIAHFSIGDMTKRTRQNPTTKTTKTKTTIKKKTLKKKTKKKPQQRKQSQRQPGQRKPQYRLFF